MIQYQFDGENVSRLSQYYGHTIGYISQNYAESFNDHTKLGKQLTAIYRKHYKGSKERLCPKLIRLCRGLIYKAKIY